MHLNIPKIMWKRGKDWNIISVFIYIIADFGAIQKIQVIQYTMGIVDSLPMLHQGDGKMFYYKLSSVENVDNALATHYLSQLLLKTHLPNISTKPNI